METSSQSPLLVAEQVAAMICMTPQWVYAQSRLGQIPTVSLGRCRRYRREAIEQWIKQLELEGPQRVRRRVLRSGRCSRRGRQR